MKIEHYSQGGKPNLPELVGKVKLSTEEALSSAGEGFAFPVPEKVSAMADSAIQSTEGASVHKSELVRVGLQSVKDAWEKAIEPRIGEIRNQSVSKEERKGGNDFFTEADVESENLIVKNFKDTFGENALRFYGEEVGGYTGNLESNITVRIDPIDGTRSFKFGRRDWCIMVGVYEGATDNQSQITASLYAPEQQEVLYYIKDVGTFVHSVETGETKEVPPVVEQNDIRELVVSLYQHSVFEERGKNTQLIEALGKEGAELKIFSSGTEVLEALLTRGRRILIFDGDMDQVDYIPYSMLVRAGYNIYEWGSDEKTAPEDPTLDNKKVVIVPPGQAGEKVRDILKAL